MSELRSVRSASQDYECTQLRTEIEVLRREKAGVETTLSEVRSELEGRRDRQRQLELEAQKYPHHLQTLEGKGWVPWKEPWRRSVATI